MLNRRKMHNILPFSFYPLLPPLYICTYSRKSTFSEAWSPSLLRPRLHLNGHPFICKPRPQLLGCVIYGLWCFQFCKLVAILFLTEQYNWTIPFFCQCTYFFYIFIFFLCYFFLLNSCRHRFYDYPLLRNFSFHF